MFNDDVPSYLAQAPTQEQNTPSYLDFPKENTSGNIQPPTTQPSLQNSQINLPQINSPKQILPYSYRAGVSPYFRNMPYQKVLGNIGQIGESVFPSVSDNSYRETSISGSFILGGAVMGYHYEKEVSKLIGAKGYGAILGALSGNLLNGYLKAKGSNQPVLQSIYGGALPMLPLLIFGKMGKDMQGKTAYQVGAAAFAYLVYQRFMVK